MVGVTKPDGSVTTTVYDNKQRVTSTVERTATGAVITGFEYTYDDLSRIIEEKVLANSTKMCYTYDNLSRVTARTVKKLSDNSVVSTETFNYDAAGNVTSAPDSSFQYDTNNRLISFNGNTVSYDLDGNMLSNGTLTCTYDSANRLVSAGGHTYTYNAEDVRIRNLCSDEDTTYTYNTNAKLSMLLMKTTDGVVTKYVYGKGLIGEEVNNTFKTYHFDCRGSTIAITDASGNITDTFAYDTYGKLLSRTGTSKAIFGYNGRDGVVTDDNGLIYMRARYYSPAMKRFINADIVEGGISNAITLNRFAYANGNPVSFVDPFGLSAERGTSSKAKETESDWIMAVLVTDFSLPIVGHSEIYFMNSYGEWLFTEYNTNVSIKDFGIKGAKGGAQVFYNTSDVDVSDFYNKETGEFIKNPKGINYVVLEGDFNKSAALAKSYYDNQNFGRYNLFFNNCADYTNKLLDVANIDGMSSQVLSEGNTLITIPVLREFELSISDAVDSGIEWASDGLIDLGNSMKGSNIVGDVVGSALVGTGNFIDGATNFVGDAIDVVTGVAGEFVDGAKYVAATVTNGIVDGAKAVWDFISFWD